MEGAEHNDWWCDCMDDGTMDCEGGRDFLTCPLIPSLGNLISLGVGSLTELNSFSRSTRLWLWFNIHLTMCNLNIDH